MPSTNRLLWKDEDWAAYLGCSVDEVVKYRTKITELYSAGIACSTITGKYRFEIYKYTKTPSGSKTPLLMYSGKNEFDSLNEAIKDANDNIISKPTFVLNDFWAKQYGLPPKSLQMLLIKQR